MKVQTLYVIAYDNSGETTKVTASLYHKHSPKSDAAVGLFAKFEAGPKAPATLYKIPNLLKGNPPGLDRVKGGNMAKNFRQPVREEMQAGPIDVGIPENRGGVGMYLLSHGDNCQDAKEDAVPIVDSLKPILEAGVRPNIVCLVRCFAACHDQDFIEEIHNKPLPQEPEPGVMGSVVVNMLVQFNKLGCRPLLTAWSAAVSTQAFKNLPGDIPRGAKVITLGKETRRPTAEDREKYKFGYFVNDDGKMIVLPASQIQDKYLVG